MVPPEIGTLICQVFLGTCLVWELSFSRQLPII